MPDVERIVMIDSQTAGVAGDMLLGALLDLGASCERISTALKAAGDNLEGCQDLRLEVAAVNRHGLRASKAKILYEESVTERPAGRIRDAITDTARYLELSPRAQQFARDTANTLIAAEQSIHGDSGHDLHFHELGTADTVADIIGVTVALEDLELFQSTVFYATPVAVGSGSHKFSHGTLSIPLPSVLEILRSRNFPLTSGHVSSELATPTGVSLLVNLADKVTSVYPAMKPLAIGYGAGSKEFTEIPNVLRVTIGEPAAEHLFQNSIYVLETSVDDVPGEVIGYTIERLFQAGARDCTVIPTYAKKNRPGQIIQVIADADQTEPLARILMAETGTLGVRYFPAQRYVLGRESMPVSVEIEDKVCQINIKVSRDKAGRIIHLKPEYEDIRTLAQESGRPLKEIARLAQEAARHVLAGED